MGTVGPAVLSNRVNGKSNSTFKRPLGPTPDDTDSSTSVSAVKIKQQREREVYNIKIYSSPWGPIHQAYTPRLLYTPAALDSLVK
jgi:hypothetical protein